jgi:hypothetical protein
LSEVASNLISRNSRCPCGSGRRYKDCHGEIGSGSENAPATKASVDAAPSAPQVTPSYRAPAAEWAHLSESARAECGVLMQRALTYQVAGQLDEAAAAYAEVLAQAPSTHDALHMAGVVELTRGNLDQAERLITAAIAVRPPYKAIEHNLQLVHDAKFASLLSGTEDLCERALPILAEFTLARGKPEANSVSSDIAASFKKPIHLIGRLDAGDSERRLRQIADLLVVHEPTVWSVGDVIAQSGYAGKTRRVNAMLGAVPIGGTHLYIGVDYDCQSWIDRADADRVIVFCGRAAPSVYIEQLRALARDGLRAIELVFPSHAMAARFGRGHHVLPPPFALDPRPNRAVEDVSIVEENRRAHTVSVGVIGQGCDCVADATDVELLRSLAGTGPLCIYDPGRLRYALGTDPRVRFIPRRSNGIVEFVATIRCFVHRATTWWAEPAHEGLFAAMAASVPVLCPSSSIFAEYIDDGIDGMLYVTEEDCAAKVADLIQTPAHAVEMGKAARAKAMRLFDPQRLSHRYAALVGGHRVEAGVPGTSLAGLELAG